MLQNLSPNDNVYHVPRRQCSKPQSHDLGQYTQCLCPARKTLEYSTVISYVNFLRIHIEHDMSIHLSLLLTSLVICRQHIYSLATTTACVFGILKYLSLNINFFAMQHLKKKSTGIHFSIP